MIRRSVRTRVRAEGEPSDDQLLADAVVSPEAFGEFYDRHYDGLLRFFAARVRAPETAADLCAETLAAALQGARNFDSSRGSAQQWLYGIARHLLSRYWRELRVSRSARDRLGVTDIPLDDRTARELDRIESATDRTRILAAMTALPADQSAAVRLRVIDELGYEEIARKLCCNEGAARVKVHRGLRRLEALLGSP